MLPPRKAYNVDILSCENVKMPSSSDKTAKNDASMLIVIYKLQADSLSWSSSVVFNSSYGSSRFLLSPQQSPIGYTTLRLKTFHIAAFQDGGPATWQSF